MGRRAPVGTCGHLWAPVVSRYSSVGGSSPSFLRIYLLDLFEDYEEPR